MDASFQARAEQLAAEFAHQASISVAVCARTIFAAGAAMRMEDVWPVSRLLAVADPGV